MRKRALSLIEIIISLALLSLLLSTLFFWYHSLSKQKLTSHQLKGPLTEERYAFQQLHPLWQKLELPFFSSKNGCVFIFDNGVTPVPELSDKVLGHLYYDADNQRLCLGIWPKPTHSTDLATSPSRSLVLLDNVSHCQFQYYSPPDPFRQSVDPEQVGNLRPSAGWHDNWEASYQTLPALVAVHIERASLKGVDTHPVDFFFDLPVKILYPKEKNV